MSTITSVAQAKPATGFILTNANGSFLAIRENTSRYEGFFVREESNVYRVIAGILPEGTAEHVTNRLWCVERNRTGGVAERYVIPTDANAVVYTISKQGEIQLLLDCKKIYDNRSWGRTYNISTEEQCLVIHYRKINDPREPSGIDAGGEYELFVAVHGKPLEALPVNAWVRQDCVFDRARSSPPFERYVYHAATLKGTCFVVAASTDKTHAIQTAKHVFARKERVCSDAESSCAAFMSEAQLPSSFETAWMCAENALRMTLSKKTTLSAGLPWFFQFWLRDTAISARAFMLMDKPLVAKKLLLSMLEDSQGKMKSNTSSTLDAIDAPGWIFLRLGELAQKDLLSDEEEQLVIQHAGTYLTRVRSSLTNGLVKNEALETWTDTSFGADDGRKGCRIEVQALVLATCKTYAFLTGTHHPLEQELIVSIRKNFWNGKLLLDGVNDKTIRPNIFLAAYACPEILSLHEWESCFDEVLPKLWLSWGGFATISKESPLFTKEHTGEDNKSYHRGDSWFWINNLSAIILHRTNPKKYKQYVDKILNASTAELMTLGIPGVAGELSSAEHLTSEGCWLQTWSNATYVELCYELFLKK